MINLFKPPIYTTAPVKQSGPLYEGARCTRTKYVLTYLAGILPVVILILYMASTSGSKHPDGPAGSAIIYLFRESGPILIALVAVCAMVAVLFFASLGRLRDINASPVWALLLFVPFLGLALIILLLLVPGTRGPNNYGADPRSNAPEDGFKTDESQYDEPTEPFQDIHGTESEASKLVSLRNWATHKNKSSQLESREEPDNFHESVKQLLRKKELIKILKKNGKVKSSKVLVAGFDKTNSKYYYSLSPLGTQVEKFSKEYFVNYEVMNAEVLSRAGLSIEYLANENS
jgi:uncharacterized membrane protein YhaH (DUF805 family)